MKISTALFSTVVYGSLSLCAPATAQTGAPAAPDTAQTAPSAPNTAQQGAELNSKDKNFLENAAQSGHTEIEGSKLAPSKATRPEVKAFAEQMIQDHTKVAQELAALAASKGYTPPTEPSLMQQAKLKALGMTDESFDKTYANQIGVSAHEDAVKLFKEAATESTDPDIKAFAQKNLPALEHHLEMARTLKQQVDPAK